MEPRQKFINFRMTGTCVYCGGPPETRDHVPSKVLLDEPYPDNLPVVKCCEACNTGFSSDEQYLACFLECVVAGSTLPNRVVRSKVARILAESPLLASQIAASEFEGTTSPQLWKPDTKRFRKVVLKLVRGHVAFELKLPRIEEPSWFDFFPIITMTDHDVKLFLNPPQKPMLPEVGSRALARVCKQFEEIQLDHWRVLQPGRYQYFVSLADGLLVRILLRGYLACEARWDKSTASTA